MRKKTTPKDLRVAEYFLLLESLSRQRLPAVCSQPEEVERILALRSAFLVEAQTDPPLQQRSGEWRIASAVVTAITAEGRNLLARTTPATKSSWRARQGPEA